MEELDKIDARKKDDILELSIEALEEFDEEEEWFLSPAVVNISKPPPSKKPKTDQNTTQLPKAHQQTQKNNTKILITAQCTPIYRKTTKQSNATQHHTQQNISFTANTHP